MDFYREVTIYSQREISCVDNIRSVSEQDLASMYLPPHGDKLYPKR